MARLQLQPDEPLLVARAGDARLLLPMGAVQHLHQAALPARLPTADTDAPPFLVVAGVPVPVFFARALLGAEQGALQASDQMVELGREARRALLWVSAVEEVVPFQPAAGTPEAPFTGSLVAGFAAAPHPLPVLDVERLLELGESFSRPADPPREVQP